MSLVSFRPLSPERIPDLLELHAANAASYPPGDQHRYFESLIAMEGLFLCLFVDDQLIAAGGLQKHEDYWWLHSLDVHPSRQRQGWGRCLIRELLAVLAVLAPGPAEITTIALNAASGAEDFYRRLGFVPYDPSDGSSSAHFCRHFTAAELQDF